MLNMVTRTPLTAEQIAEGSALKRIYEARKRLGKIKSQEDLAIRCGWSGQSVVGQLMNGHMAINLEQSVRIADALACRVSDFSPRLAQLLNTVCEPSPPIQAHAQLSGTVNAIVVPVIKKTEATMLKQILTTPDNARPTALLKDPPDGKIFAFQVDDDSLVEPGDPRSMPRGSTLFVNSEASLSFGDFVIVLMPDGLAYCRQYISDGTAALLRPLNRQFPSYPAPHDRGLYLGVVIRATPPDINLYD